jgi:hypothetical protein
VFRKITNGFRTEWGAKFYANIRSVIETAPAAPSERSNPSASRWPECRSRTLREPHAATGGLSNYENFE